MSTQAAVAAPAVSKRRPLLAGAGVLSAAMLVSGALTYAFHVVAARALGPAEYGHVAVLWAGMFLAAVVVCRPLEQTVARALAERLARGEETASVLRAAAGLGGAVLAALALAAALLLERLGHALFDGDESLAALLLAGVAVYAVAYLVRGVLGGLRWFGGYGLALVADTGARLAMAIPLLVVASLDLAAAAVVAAGVAGIVAPLAVGRRRLRACLVGGRGERFRPAAALAFAAPAGVVAGADQLFVNGGPLLVALTGGAGAAQAAGLVFAATMVVRVPVFLFQGLAASLLPNVAALNAAAEPELVRRTVGRAASVAAGAGLVVFTGAVAAGPEALRLLYGEEYEAGRGELALLGAGVGCYLVAAVLSQALLALGRAGRAAAAWGASAPLFIGLYLALPGTELLRIGAGFGGAAAAGLVLLAVQLAGRLRVA